MSYDWSQYGLLPTYRFSKTVGGGGSYEIGWNTTAQLHPITGEKFVRVRAVVVYPGSSQTITDQLSLSGGAEWPNPGDGYRIFRLSGSLGGKG